MNIWEIIIKLHKRENWTDELIYVHRTRIVFGLIAGFLLGFPSGLFLAAIL